MNIHLRKYKGDKRYLPTPGTLEKLFNFAFYKKKTVLNEFNPEVCHDYDPDKISFSTLRTQTPNHPEYKGYMEFLYYPMYKGIRVEVHSLDTNIYIGRDILYSHYLVFLNEEEAKKMKMRKYGSLERLRLKNERVSEVFDAYIGY